MTLAGVLPDLDGARIVWSHDAYVAAHRAAHRLLFSLVLVALLQADARWPTPALTALWVLASWPNALVMAATLLGVILIAW